MHKHHCECEHECLHYCKKCDTVYCCKCAREWGNNIIYYTPSDTTTVYPDGPVITWYEAGHELDCKHEH